MATNKAKEFKDVPVDKLRARIKESRESRKKYEVNWDDSKAMYDGRQWEGTTKIAWFQSEPVFNKYFEFIETMRGYLSDNKWGVDAVPATTPEGADMETVVQMADRMNKLLDFLWVEQRMQNKLAQVLQYVFMYGTGIIKASFDPDNIAEDGIGQIETTVLSPRYIFPDPDCSDVHDASYIIEHHPVTYRWVIEHYPDQAKKVVESGETSQSQYYEGKAGAGGGAPSNAEAKRIDIYECWYRDSSMIEDDGEELKPAYPNGRMTLMTEGGIVLDDKQSEYGMFPYVRFIEIPRPNEFFGECTAHKAIGIQKNINTILRAIIDNGLWLVHGIWVADTNSGVTPSTLAGYGPRATVMKNPGTDVHRDAGEALPGHIFETLKQQVDSFNRVVGLPDVLLGIVPSRQPVQTTMMQQESGEVRTRERQRRVEESLADLGKLWIDIVANHWNDKRIIRNKRVLGGFDMFQMNKKDLEDWRFDVQVVPGSTGPMDRIAQIQMLTEARTQAGVQIPDQTFIRLMGINGLEQDILDAQASQMAAPDAAQQTPPQPEAQQPDPNAMPPIDPAMLAAGAVPPAQIPGGFDPMLMPPNVDPSTIPIIPRQPGTPL